MGLLASCAPLPELIQREVFFAFSKVFHRPRRFDDFPMLRSIAPLCEGSQIEPGRRLNRQLFSFGMDDSPPDGRGPW